MRMRQVLKLFEFQISIQYQFLTVSLMQKLINDPACIPFLNKKHISLFLLKNQINRRIVKITTMIRHKKTQNSQPNILTLHHQFTQTDNKLNFNIVFEDPPSEINVLCPSKTYHPNVYQNQPYKLKIRNINKNQGPKNISNKKTKNLYKQSNSQWRCMTSQTQIEQHIVQSNRFTFCGNRSEDNSQIKTEVNQRQGQNEYIFEKIDLATQISSISQKNHRQKSLYKQEQYNDYLKSEETLISFHTDYSTSDRAKLEPIPRRKNTKGIKILSRDLNVSESEPRFVISSQLLQRMRGETEDLIQRRRKELLDSKVRQNMLKKIEGRYGELDCN